MKPYFETCRWKLKSTMILKETEHPQVQTIAGCLNAQYQQNDTLTVYSASRMPSIKNPFT